LQAQNRRKSNIERIGTADPVREEQLSIGATMTFAGYRRDDGRFGVATADIAAGEHVHTHNMASRRALGTA
jgi:hypothetical protein